MRSDNQPGRRKLAAIMFTDIVGYTALMQEDEAMAYKLRSIHRKIFEEQHQKYQGEILQYYGDGTLSIFDSGVDAVLCAMSIQVQLWNGNPKVPLRIGIHIGDVVYTSTEIYGNGVNIASRIENLGVAGSILISEKLNDELNNHKNINTQSIGIHHFKNVRKPMEVFAIVHEGLELPPNISSATGVNKFDKSIAVLPFVNMSTDPENEFFSDGMTEEIINALTKIQGLKVTSRTSSFYFKNKQIPIGKIGKELNVAIIMEGSIRLAGSKMRITIQLINVAEDNHFWSETFDRSVEDVFALQDEISLLAAERLREQLGHFEIKEHLVENQEIPFDSYLQYLKSRYYMLQMSRKGIETGLSILKEVVEKNPGYALAYLGIHMAYTLHGTMGYMPAIEAFRLGKSYLKKAIQLDETLPECQLHLAWDAFLQDLDLEATYRHLQKVVEVRPMVDYYQTMASVLVAEGKFATALDNIETAMQLDPFSEINYHLKGFIFYVQERYEDAIVQFKQNLALKADSRVSVLYWGQALIQLNRAKEALQLFQNLPEPPDDLLKMGGILIANIALGNLNESKAGLMQIEQHLDTEMMERSLLLLILCETALGNHEKAIKWIENGIKNRLPMMVYLPVEPWLKPLQKQPRFNDLMDQVFVARKGC